MSSTWPPLPVRGSPTFDALSHQKERFQVGINHEPHFEGPFTPKKPVKARMLYIHPPCVSFACFPHTAPSAFSSLGRLPRLPDRPDAARLPSAEGFRDTKVWGPPNLARPPVAVVGRRRVPRVSGARMFSLGWPVARLAHALRLYSTPQIHPPQPPN